MKRKFGTQIYDVDRKSFEHFFTINRRRYALFPNDNAVSLTLINNQIYEPYLFWFLNDNAIDLTGTDVIDVGANNGHFTIEFADLVGEGGRVYAFEPQRIIYQQLCGNVFMNGLDNVYAYNVALGDQEGKTNIEVPDYYYNGPVNFGDVRLVNPGEVYAYEQVDLRTLDSYDFRNVSIIKIDVQGYEPWVIRGAKNTIKRHNPYLFVEIEGESLEKFSYDERSLISEIESLGYAVFRFQKGVPYQTKTGTCLDCVCIPIEKYNAFPHVIR